MPTTEIEIGRKSREIDERCYRLVASGLPDWRIEQKLRVSSCSMRAKRHAVLRGKPWPLRKGYTAPNEIKTLRAEVARIARDLRRYRAEVADLQDTLREIGIGGEE